MRLRGFPITGNFYEKMKINLWTKWYIRKLDKNIFISVKFKNGLIFGQNNPSTFSEGAKIRTQQKVGRIIQNTFINEDNRKQIYLRSKVLKRVLP